MKKKLIITENQLKRITNFITEDTDHSVIVKQIEEDLNKNYRKVIETYREGNEYKKRRSFEIIFDGKIISPKNLLEYFKLKYPAYGVNFLKQVIKDWCDNKIKNGMLSINIGIND